MKVNTIQGYNCGNALAFGYKLAKPEKGSKDVWRTHFEEQEKDIYDARNKCDGFNSRLSEIDRYSVFIQGLKNLKNQKCDIAAKADSFRAKVDELDNEAAKIEFEQFVSTLVKGEKDPHSVDIRISQPFATYNPYSNKNRSCFKIEIGNNKKVYEHTFFEHSHQVARKDDEPNLVLGPFAGPEGPDNLKTAVDRAVYDMFNNEYEKLFDRVQKYDEKIYGNDYHADFRKALDRLY